MQSGRTTCPCCSSRCAESGRSSPLVSYALNSPCAAGAWHGRGLVCYARSREGMGESGGRKAAYQSYSLERGKSQAPRKPEEHDEITIAGLRSTFKNASFPQRDSGQAPRALDPDRLPTRSMLPHRGGDARRRRVGSCLLAAAIASCAGVQQSAASSTPRDSAHGPSLAIAIPVDAKVAVLLDKPWARTATHR